MELPFLLLIDHTEKETIAERSKEIWLLLSELIRNDSIQELIRKEVVDGQAIEIFVTNLFQNMKLLHHIG